MFFPPTVDEHLFEVAGVLLLVLCLFFYGSLEEYFTPGHLSKFGFEVVQLLEFGSEVVHHLILVDILYSSVLLFVGYGWLSFGLADDVLVIFVQEVLRVSVHV